MDTKRILAAAAGAVVTASLAPLALANPYAGTVTEAGGQVTFRLNENADEVIIIRDGVATSLGAQNRGSVTFARNGDLFLQAFTPPPAGSGADFNGDSVVDELDLQIWRQNVGGPGPAGDAPVPQPKSAFGLADEAETSASSPARPSVSNKPTRKPAVPEPTVAGVVNV